MKHRIASSCLLAVIGFCAAASAQNPFVGSWKLNQAKSQLTGDTVKYSPAAAGAIQETTAVDSYTFKPDGKPYKTAFQTTAIWKRVSTSLWVVKYRRNAILLDTDTMRISPDGKKMSISSTGTTHRSPPRSVLSTPYPVRRATQPSPLIPHDGDIP